MTADSVPQIFDPGRLALRRVRAARQGGRFLGDLAERAVTERLGDIARPFADGIVIDGDSGVVERLSAVSPIAFRTLSSEAMLTAQKGHSEPVDCILWPGGLESLSDVPGALARARGLIKPDGVLLGAFWGGGSLPVLRSVMAAGDGDSPKQRLHPQIDVKAMGDLLQRTGYALPMIDREPVTLRYREFGDMIADLRGSALTNVLAGPFAGIDKAALSRAKAAFEDLRDKDGKVSETLMLVHFTGWRPDPSQPQPAKRGSASQSLADALRSSQSEGSD